MISIIITGGVILISLFNRETVYYRVKFLQEFEVTKKKGSYYYSWICPEIVFRFSASLLNFSPQPASCIDVNLVPHNELALNAKQCMHTA